MERQQPDEIRNELSGVQLTYDGELVERPAVIFGKSKRKSKPKFILDRPFRRYALTTTILIFGLVVGLGIGLLSNNTTQVSIAVASLSPTNPVLLQGTQPGPAFIYPVNGQTLDYEGAYLFKVSTVPSAQGYLYGFFQNDKMVWENWRDQHTLSGVEYGIGQGTPAHDMFVPGDVQVMVRAQIAGHWTNATSITIHLRPRCQSNPNCLTTTPTFTPIPAR